MVNTHFKSKTIGKFFFYEINKIVFVDEMYY